MRALLLTCLTFVVFIGIYTQLTLFIVPPIGAVPEGRTLVLWRYSVTEAGEIKGLNLEFIDSADAICARHLGHVNLLCRGVMLGAVAGGSTILLRLPYSELLNSIADANVR